MKQPKMTIKRQLDTFYKCKSIINEDLNKVFQRVGRYSKQKWMECYKKLLILTRHLKEVSFKHCYIY